MARAVTPLSLTPADELRDLLEGSERLAVNLSGSGPDQAVRLLDWLDRIALLLPELEADGVNLQAERGRWQAVQGSVKRHSRDLLAEMKATGGLAAARSRRSSPPPAANWWWQIDGILAAERKRKMLTWAAAVGIVLVLLFGGYWLFNRLFPVDPVVAAVYRHRSDAEQYVALGELEPALASYEAAATLDPDDPELLAALVALYAATGREADAEAALARLRPLLPEAEVDAYLAAAYAGVHLLDQAMTYAEQALAVAPDLVAALITAADVSQALGRQAEAMAYLRRADAAAGEQNLIQMQAVIRMRLAQVMQQPMMNTPAEE